MFFAGRPSCRGFPTVFPYAYFIAVFLLLFLSFFFPHTLCIDFSDVSVGKRGFIQQLLLSIHDQTSTARGSEVLKIWQRTKYAKLLFMIHAFGSICTFQYFYRTIILVSYSRDIDICRGTSRVKIIH